MNKVNFSRNGNTESTWTWWGGSQRLKHHTCDKYAKNAQPETSNDESLDKPKVRYMLQNYADADVSRSWMSKT